MPTSCLFATSNSYKFVEFSRLFGAAGLTLDHYYVTVDEVQHIEMEAIVRDKALKAYQRVRRPVLVEHSGLSMKVLNGLPRGLNRQFWEKLQDRVCDLGVALGDSSAEILVSLALCDGRRIYTWHVSRPGKLASKPASVGTFHLDQVFIPNGATVTLAEMSETERDRVSQRRYAVDESITELLRRV